MSHRTLTRSTVGRLARLAVLATIATAAASPAAHAQDAEASLRLNWKMKGEFSPFVYAAEKGLFQQHGIKVDVEEGSGATLALQAVATGQDDFAYVPSVQLIQAVNNGMPVIAIATVSKVDSMGIVGGPGVDISSPKDLEGKSIEIAASSTFNNIWSAFAAKNDIDQSKVEVVSVNPGARFNLLMSGQVDVLADIFMTNEYPVLNTKTDEPLKAISVGDWGFPIIGYTLVTRTDTLAEKPDTVRSFLAAAKEGFQAALDDPDGTASVAVEAYPDTLMPAATKGQVEALKAFLEQGEPKSLFVGSDEGWNATLNTLKDVGVVSSIKAPSSYYTNDYLPN